MKRVGALLGIAGFVVGLLVAYLLFVMPQQRAADDLRAAETRLADQAQQIDELQAKVSAAEARLQQVAADLESERELRHRYEVLINQGK